MVNQPQYDRPTGIYNKEYFYKCARDILRQNPGEEYDIICSDIENFKPVNDIFRHFSRGLPASGNLRAVPGNHKRSRHICRIGADQFALYEKTRRRYTDDMFIHFPYNV